MFDTDLNTHLSAAEQVILRQHPVVIASRRNPLPPLEERAMRIVLGADGVYLQSRSHALEATIQISQCRLPFGPMSPQLEILCRPNLAHLKARVVEFARAASPKEWAGALVLNEQGMVLTPARQAAATPASVTFDRYTANDLVIDMHSHANMKAYHSATDDADDAACEAQIFLSGVVGRVNTPTPQWAWRIVINGFAAELDERGVPQMARSLV